ncbi:MAG: hypothetical protein K6F28_10025 [Lachnospiraceae bacterium]|nr:hypothetical protein [Lachnospiraceae bacterium]
MYIFANPNPAGLKIGDCVVRAIAISSGMDWDTAYNILVDYGFNMKEMPNANSVWGQLLIDSGFTRHVIPDTCPACYTVREFCRDHPKGTYVLGTGSHVVAVIDGNYYDTWDSGDEVPLIYWREYGTL